MQNICILSFYCVYLYRSNQHVQKYEMKRRITKKDLKPLKLSLRKVAVIVGYSKTHVERAFKQERGVSEEAKAKIFKVLEEHRLKKAA